MAYGEKLVPREYINDASDHITQAMRGYVITLMCGEADVEIDADGLPIFALLKRDLVPKKA